MSFEDIITLVKTYPAIWQRSCPYYNKRSTLTRVWREIATELRIDEKYARKRWKHLKDQYRKEVRKMQASNITDLDTYESCWKYFHLLSFLKDDILGDTERVRKMSDSDQDEDRPIKSESESESDDSPSAKKPKKTENCPRPDGSFKPSGTPVPVLEDNRIGAILKRLRTINNMMETNKSKEALMNDPDHMFLMSILPLMRSLTDIQKLHFRGKVNDLLLEAFMQNECNNPIDDSSMVYLHTKIGMEKEG